MTAPKAPLALLWPSFRSAFARKRPRWCGRRAQAALPLPLPRAAPGGLIAGALTEVPGSSEAVLGGIVSYANSVKEGQLGVSAEVLASDGAVSEACALQMCQGARNQLGSSCAVAVTGIAGPGGAVPGKPVGTVWVGYADATGARAQLCHFEGDRQQVRLQTVEFALDCFLRHLSS